MAKQTAGNNQFLKHIKAQWNGKVYKRVLELVNANGIEAAFTWLTANVTSRDINEYRAMCGLPPVATPDPTPPAAASDAIPADIQHVYVSQAGAIRMFRTEDDVEMERIAEFVDCNVDAEEARHSAAMNELDSAWELTGIRSGFGKHYTRRQPTPATDGAGKAITIINQLISRQRIESAADYPSIVPATDGAGEYDHDAQLASIAADMKAHVEKVGGPAIASVMFELSFGQNPDGQDVADAFDEFNGQIGKLKKELAEIKRELQVSRLARQALEDAINKAYTACEKGQPRYALVLLTPYATAWMTDEQKALADSAGAKAQDGV